MSRPRPQIVGRERELAVASAVLEGLHKGGGGLVLEGEAGIGKTALWRAIVEQASARGYQTLTCQADQSETQLAFAGLCDLVDPSADLVLAALPAPQREVLEIALLRRTPSAEWSPDRRTLGVALHSLLCDLASEAPLVVAIDDLQWLDTSTLRLLAFAARRLQDQPVLILLTERGPPFTADPLGMERALGADRLMRVRLGGLQTGEIGSLLEWHLGHSYSRRVTAKVAQASGGNPLFALECARALDPKASIDPTEPLPVPDSLRELIRVRLEAISPAAREALLATATLARPTTALVEQASSSDGLASAEESDLVRVSDEDRVQFTHPLFAAAVYDTASRSRRRRMHQRLTDLLEDRDERAHHLAFAATEPEEEIALELERAASNARSRGASAAAAGLLEQAIEMTPAHMPEASLRRMTQAAEDHLFAGEGERPRTLLKAVIAGLAPGPERARAMCALGQVLFWHESYAEAGPLFTEALEQADDDEWVRSRALMDLGWVKAQRQQFAGLQAELAEALAIAERLEDPQLLAESLSGTAVVSRMLGQGHDEQMMERALALERFDTRTYVGLRPSFNAAWIYLWTGRVEHARSRYASLEEQLIANGQESAVPLSVIPPVLIECAAGELARALEIAERAVAAARESDSRIMHATTLGASAYALAQLGRVEEAERDVSASRALFEHAGEGDGSAAEIVLTAAQGFIALSLGDYARADRVLSPFASAALEHGIGEPMLAAFLPDEIEALVSLRELERAEPLIALLERQGQRLSSAWGLATAGRVRGMLLAAQGELDAATAMLEHALAHHQGLPMPLELARTLLVQGRVRRRCRQKRAAGESLRAALTIFEECGAALWAKQTRAEIDRLGTRTAPKQLTVTEKRVATLAARGMTNKQIAAELFISPKTVEANIARVYRKLGIKSRAQLGGAMTAHPGSPGSHQDGAGDAVVGSQTVTDGQ